MSVDEPTTVAEKVLPGDEVLELFGKEMEKIDELQIDVTSDEATLKQHQEFNRAFDKARKEFEDGAKKIQTSIEESIAKADEEIENTKAAANADRAAATKLSQELKSVQRCIETTSNETKEVNDKLAAIAESKPSATTLSSLGTDESNFYSSYEKVLIEAKSLLFRSKNQVSTPTSEEVAGLEQNVTELKGTASDNIFGSIEAAEEVSSLYEAVRLTASGATDEANANSEAHKDSTAPEDFMKESNKLLQWCRQQKTDLEALTEPDHIQKFCNALEANYKTMYDNFDMLCAMGQELMPNPRVEKTLMECNEVWLNLQIFAHEVLQHTMLEIHARSKLEDEVRAFSTYSVRLNDTLKSLKEMFSLPMDDESKAVVAGVLAQTEQLLADFLPHTLLSEHLKEFSLRMECLRDNYNNLRRTVFGRLTFLSHQQLPLLNTSHRRRDEYLTRMRDLRSWVEKKDQGESCENIYNRVIKMKELIEKEYEQARGIPSEKELNNEETIAEELSPEQQESQ